MCGCDVGGGWVPNPSGRKRWYNDKANKAKAEVFLVGFGEMIYEDHRERTGVGSVKLWPGRPVGTTT